MTAYGPQCALSVRSARTVDRGSLLHGNILSQCGNSVEAHDLTRAFASDSSSHYQDTVWGNRICHWLSSETDCPTRWGSSQLRREHRCGSCPFGPTRRELVPFEAQPRNRIWLAGHAELDMGRSTRTQELSGCRVPFEPAVHSMFQCKSPSQPRVLAIGLYQCVETSNEAPDPAE